MRRHIPPHAIDRRLNYSMDKLDCLSEEPR